jgi:hypothetical protein
MPACLLKSKHAAASLAQHMEALREYTAREGYELLEEVSDPNQSGASANGRPMAIPSLRPRRGQRLSWKSSASVTGIRRYLLLTP